jgi:hypothetical protein
MTFWPNSHLAKIPFLRELRTSRLNLHKTVAVWTIMVRSGLLTLLTVAVTLSAFAQQPKPEKVLPLKRRIPPANSAKYPSLWEPTDWQNPFLVVGEGGIAV